MIIELLEANNEIYRFVKVANSGVSFILYNGYTAIDESKWFRVEENLEAFYTRAEKKLLLSIAQNRLALNIEVKEMGTVSAY